MKKRKFTGALATPITIRTRSVTIFTDTPEERDAISKYNNSEFLRSLCESLQKVDLLCKEFDVPTDQDAIVKFVLLTLALAREYVPGFRVKNLSISRERGRLKEWNTVKYMELVADVETVKRGKRRSDSEACTILVTTRRFTSRWGKYDARTLKNRLVEARQADKNIFFKIFEQGNIKDTTKRQQIMDALIETFGITRKQS